MRSGTLSRSVAAAIAPGRITRGRVPVQSTTVEGGEEDSLPPSRTRNTPRAIASLHCETISDAAIAAGDPGRFALVEVNGRPYRWMR